MFMLIDYFNNASERGDCEFLSIQRIFILSFIMAANIPTTFIGMHFNLVVPIILIRFSTIKIK